MSADARYVLHRRRPSGRFPTSKRIGYGVTTQWRLALRDLALAGVLIAWPLASTVFELVASWQKSGAYHYAWLVVPMFVYLVGWHFREQILSERPQPDSAGVYVALVAAIGWSIAAAAQIAIGRQLALIAIVHGIVWSALGRALYWRLLPTMGLLLLMLPSADLLLDPLRRATQKSIEWFALASGLSYRSDGFSLSVGEHSYVVLEACSGLEHVLLTFFLGYCFGLLVFRSLAKTVALALFAAVLGLLSNVLRVNTIVWIDQLRGFRMDLAAHGTIQWLALLLILALFFRVLIVLAALRGDGERQWPVAASVAPAPPASRRRMALAAGLGVLAITGLTSVRLQANASVTLAHTAADLPATAGDWQAVAPPGAWSPVGGLRVLTADYRRGSGRLEIGVVEARVAGAKLSLEPLLSKGTDDWRAMGSEALSACDALRCIEVVHAVRRNAVDSSVRHVYYAYFFGHRNTSSMLALRLATAFSRLSGASQAARLIAVSVDGEPLPGAELVALFRAVTAATGNEPA